MSLFANAIPSVAIILTGYFVNLVPLASPATVKGAVSRALGFALTFYPSIMMLAIDVGVIFWQQLS
ncbi:MAG: hypothetical protein R3208_21265 [Ketobacteraceae bacterium]|nr:hypothetical protein [Ketobacteraceae bacterium]